MSSTLGDFLSTCKTTVEERDPLDIPSYLSNQNLFPKFYWKCAKTGEERACLGSLITLTSPPALSKETDPALCFYGSLFFSDQTAKDPFWKDFSPSCFFLPEFEIRQSNLKTELISHSLNGSGGSPLLEENETLSPTCTLKKNIDIPSKETWTTSIKKILKAIKEKQVDKVVLARRTTFSIDLMGNPFNWLQKLLNTCPSTSTFALQTCSSSLFLGSTPEKLYSRKGRTLSTESIAGTRKRGKDAVEDTSLAEELLSSLKDKAEVNFVKDFLTERLTSLCDEVLVDENASLKKTDTVQHLYYAFKATLKDRVTDANILSALHPTPAVNGHPKKQALQLIAEIEEFDRGLYAGSIGWISSAESFFAVTIRSALIRGSFLHAFAGTGIVEGSDPDLEWMELQHKISHWQ